MLSQRGGVGYVSISNALFENRGLKIDAIGIVIFASISRYANKKGVCWPSHETIATDCRLTRRTVIKHLSRLEAAGLIKIDSGKKRGGSSRYTILLRPEPRGVKQIHTPVKQIHTPVKQIHTKDLQEGPESKDPRSAGGDFPSLSNQQAEARKKTDKEAAAITTKGDRFKAVETLIPEYRSKRVSEDRLLHALNRLAELGDTVKYPAGFLRKLLDEALDDQARAREQKQRQEDRARAFKADQTRAGEERDNCFAKIGKIDLVAMVNSRSGIVLSKPSKLEEAA